MIAHHVAPELSSSIEILQQTTQFKPTDPEYINHPLIQHLGSPEKLLHIDINTVNINNIEYINPIILPIYNGQIELIQCAIIGLDKPVTVLQNGIAKGFACFGNLSKQEPILITYSLEAFFKIAQTGYAVVLVILPKLCSTIPYPLNPFTFKQIEFVIRQLANAGFQNLYMPVKPEHFKKESFQDLEKETPVKLLNQYIESDDGDDLIELHREDNPHVVRLFIEESINKLSKQNVSHNDHWEELVPLTLEISTDSMRYPINRLPNTVREAILAISEHVQAPIAMTAQCVLSTLTHIAQARVNAPSLSSTHIEPCSLYFLTEGQSGSRKSTSLKLAGKALHEYERKAYEAYQQELHQWNNSMLALNKKEQIAVSAQTPHPIDPSTQFSDVTVEAIVSKFIDGDIKNASISSDEAGQFFGGYSMRADTRNQSLSIFTKAFDDGYVERTRSKSNLNGSGRAYDIRLTCNLQGQREILSDALNHPVYRGQGFLPRCILTVPENLAGTRLKTSVNQDIRPENDPRLLNYWGRCSALLDECPLPYLTQPINGRYVLQMTAEAQEIDKVFYNECELLQAPGQRYHYLQAFAGRGSQLARRLATVLAYFEGLSEIDTQIMQGACAIIRHSLNEWARYTEIEPVKESDAEKLLKKILSRCSKEKTHRISRTTILKGAPSHLRKKEKFDPCLEELREHNYVRLITINQTMYIEVNPTLLN